MLVFACVWAAAATPHPLRRCNSMTSPRSPVRSCPASHAVPQWHYNACPAVTLPRDGCVRSELENLGPERHQREGHGASRQPTRLPRSTCSAPQYQAAPMPPVTQAPCPLAAAAASQRRPVGQCEADAMLCGDPCGCAVKTGRQHGDMPL